LSVGRDPVRKRPRIGEQHDKRRKGQMRRSSWSIVVVASAVVALGVALMLPGPAVLAAARTPDLSCPAKPFSADVLSGPDRDLSLVGRLSIAVGGRVTGTLRTAAGAVPVTGSVSGGSLRLVFHLRSGLRMTGVGVSKVPITDCAGLPRRGTATGPRHGDTGRWGYAIGG